MNVKKISKTIVTALVITVLGISVLGLTAYAHEGEATPIEVYRLYTPNATGIYEVGAHHYTANEWEKDWLVGLGWQYEGVGWKVIE